MGYSSDSYVVSTDICRNGEKDVHVAGKVRLVKDNVNEIDSHLFHPITIKVNTTETVNSPLNFKGDTLNGSYAIDGEFISTNKVIQRSKYNFDIDNNISVKVTVITLAILLLLIVVVVLLLLLWVRRNKYYYIREEEMVYLSKIEDSTLYTVIEGSAIILLHKSKMDSKTKIICSDYKIGLIDNGVVIVDDIVLYKVKLLQE